MRRVYALCFLLSLWSLSCNTATSLLNGVGASSDPLCNVPDDDPDMNAAIQKAQDSLDTFIENLNAPSEKQTHFSIKARFPFGSSGAAEHIWIDSISYDARTEKFTGQLANEPVYVEGMQPGDSVTVDRADVSDWLIVENEKFVGGYTIRAGLKCLSPEEQVRLREMFADMDD